MSLARWRTALRAVHTQRPVGLPFIATRTTRLLQKPGLQKPHLRLAALRSPAPVQHQHVLQSRFPTKTFIALVALGTAAYFLIDVDLGDDFIWNIPPQLIHFYPTQELLEMGTQVRLQNTYPDPENRLEETTTEFLARCSMGMTVEDAKKLKLPVTQLFHLSSNTPAEDTLAIGTAPGVAGQLWNYWGVYDGHAGSWTAQILQDLLIPYVSKALSKLNRFSTDYDINDTIAKSFLQLDDQMFTNAKTQAAWQPPLSARGFEAVLPVISGSCALLAMFDPKSSILRVACVGDSRAVLGRWDPVEEKYVAMPLSRDQTGFNESEVERVKKDHPGEDDILDPSTGRLLGMAITRAFGDHRWKWPDEIIQQIQYKFWGSRPRPNSRTPPYMTAEPVITETEIERGDGPGSKADFLIMASDGLWDTMSNETAVKLVQLWLEARDRGNGKVAQDPQLEPNKRAAPYGAPEPGVTYDSEAKQYPTWEVEPQYYAIEDETAGACLARNAFGGTRRGLVTGVLAMPSPISRNVRDDTTIIVVFFDRVPDEDKPPLVPKDKEFMDWYVWGRAFGF